MTARAQDGDGRSLSRDACAALFRRVVALGSGGGETMMQVNRQWSASVRWARNQLTSTSDMMMQFVNVARVVGGARGDAGTMSFDDDSLRVALASAERLVRFSPQNPDAPPLPGKQQYVQPRLWGESTAAVSARARVATAGAAVEPVVRAGLLSAGDLQVTITSRALFTTSGMDAHAAWTEVAYSVTIRDAAGTGSGWAGINHRDWSAVDVAALTERARHKCVTSVNPVPIEPGRYTLIMEPPAVHALMVNAVGSMDRQGAEQGWNPFAQSPGQSKIGRKVFDERITLSTDPADPDMPYAPFDYEGYPYRAVTWVENGVLKELAYNRQYALSQLGLGAALPNPGAYRMSGGDTTLDEMIGTTDRGLLVTRFSSIGVLDSKSLLCTGVTRDGLWLVEHGRVIKPVTNMRFMDSPMLVFNRVLQIGRSERVFGWSGIPVAVPAVKVRDFNFTSLSDAV